jgi:hypothetical protein
MNRRSLAALLLCAALVLAGCGSGLRLGYNQAEWLADWAVSGYVELDSRQRELFSQRFRQLHAWHRADQLPGYGALLRETRSRVEAGLSTEDVLWITERVRIAAQAVAIRSADDIAELLASLTPAQLAELERSFAQSNRKVAREWGVGRSPAEQRRLRADRLIAQVERFTGRLSGEQVERVRSLVEPLPLTADARLADRERRQRELLAALRAARSSPELAAWLRDWLPQWERGRDPQYARLADRTAQQRAQILAEVDRLLTPSQRRTAGERLQSYAEDMVALSTPAGRQQRAAN